MHMHAFCHSGDEVRALAANSHRGPFCLALSVPGPADLIMCMQHFGLILNYLRDGECDLPTDPRERKDLLREAEHYEVNCSIPRCILLSQVPKATFLVASTSSGAFLHPIYAVLALHC